LASHIQRNNYIGKEKTSTAAAAGACLLAIDILVAVSDVQEEVFLVMLLKQTGAVSQ
jgi:hypothetical protein